MERWCPSFLRAAPMKPICSATPRIQADAGSGGISVMRIPAVLLAAVCVSIFVPASRVYAAAPDKDVLIVVPHTHWEGAVFKTREEYLEIGLPHILEALSLLKRYPEYRFVLDQMCYVEALFLDRYPTGGRRVPGRCWGNGSSRLPGEPTPCTTITCHPGNPSRGSI